MNEIGSFDAKNKLSELLAKAERGEEIIITRRGRPVAKLGPVSVGHDIEGARAAMRRIRTLAQQMKLGPYDWSEWKSHRDQGRR
ncbi:MAG: type II toxin-antitoxin system prevent-host-death family antitoxin [Hyphomicrobiales bacterium]|nr:type II toxin-antitoxin system prevent-host-death family antitoxin [Alphaproteobacteria bacterium]